MPLPWFGVLLAGYNLDRRRRREIRRARRGEIWPATVARRRRRAAGRRVFRDGGVLRLGRDPARGPVSKIGRGLGSGCCSWKR